MERTLPWLEAVTFGAALVVLVLTTPDGPGAFGVVDGGTWIRAVLAAVTLAGVVACARVLVPRDPVAGVVGAALLVLAPPFRLTAVAGSIPAIAAAAACVWAAAFVIGHARAPSPRHRAAAIAAIALALVAWVAAARARTSVVDPSLTALVAATGVGSAAVVVGAGLLGVTFGAVTGLPHARLLALAVAIVTAHAIVFDHQPAALLALLAAGVAVIPSAIVRVVGSPRRTLVALGAGVPLVIAALLTGPAL